MDVHSSLNKWLRKEAKEEQKTQRRIANEREMCKIDDEKRESQIDRAIIK